MSFTCPRGHASATDDYCSVCGIRNPGSAVMAGERPETTREPQEEDQAGDGVAVGERRGLEPVDDVGERAHEREEECAAGRRDS